MISNVAGFAASDDAVLTVIQVYPLHIDLITRFPDGRIYMQFSASPGHYEIEAATNLSSAAAAWAELTNFFTTVSTFEFTDSQTNLPQRFYRVKSLSP